MSVKLDSLNTVAIGLKTNVAHFNPYLDEFGIIKSNSKLTKLDREYETKYPVILHRRSDFTKLLVTNLHFQFEHPVSFAAMKALVRKHYVILGLGTRPDQSFLSAMQETASCPDEATNGSITRTKSQLSNESVRSCWHRLRRSI